MLGRISRAHDPAEPLAAQPRRLDEIHHHDIHRDGARQAEDPGRVEERDDEDQIEHRRAEDRQQHQREDQVRDRHQHIDERATGPGRSSRA